LFLQTERLALVPNLIRPISSIKHPIEVANTDKTFCKVTARSTKVLGDERGNARLKTLTEEQREMVVDIFKRYLEQALAFNLVNIYDLFQL
jgi:hypothetical protein